MSLSRCRFTPDGCAPAAGLCHARGRRPLATAGSGDLGAVDWPMALTSLVGFPGVAIVTVMAL